MTTVQARSRLLATLLTFGLALCSAAPVSAGTDPALPGGDVTPDIVDSAQGEGRVVALTFDDGPNPGDTPRMLDVLSQHGVRAVFCLCGELVREHPDIVRRIVEEGHVLCNHTTHHDDMSTWSPERVRADLMETDAAIREAVPDAAVPYFRAPYGAWGRTPEVAVELGMQPLGWSVDVRDWERPGTEEIVRRLREDITPGTVVLLHDGGGDRSQTVAAVDQIIPELRSEGWEFTSPASPG